MKKRIAVLMIVVILSTVLVPLANAAGSNESHDVKGMYKGGDREDLFSVDIVWQGMKFDYIAPTEEWNSTNHEWEQTSGAKWQVAENSGNQISVTNHSSLAVDIALTAAYTVEGVSGSFSKDSFTLPLPTEGEEGATAETVTFMPSGTLASSVTDYSKIGSITVTVSAEDNTEEPDVDTFTVKFVDYDGSVLKIESVQKGNAAHAPADPMREGYSFVKWDKAFDNVLSDLTVTAIYQQYSKSTIYVGVREAKAGDTVEVPVYITNNPGITGAMITISFDENLELTNAASGEAFSELTYTKPGKFTSPCNFSWYSENSTVVNDGIILTLTFKVAEDVSVGDILNISCSYIEGDIYDADLNDVTFDVMAGAIKVK